MKTLPNRRANQMEAWASSPVRQQQTASRHHCKRTARIARICLLPIAQRQDYVGRTLLSAAVDVDFEIYGSRNLWRASRVPQVRVRSLHANLGGRIRCMLARKSVLSNVLRTPFLPHALGEGEVPMQREDCLIRPQSAEIKNDHVGRAFLLAALSPFQPREWFLIWKTQKKFVIPNSPIVRNLPSLKTTPNRTVDPKRERAGLQASVPVLQTMAFRPYDG